MATVRDHATLIEFAIQGVVIPLSRRVVITGMGCVTPLGVDVGTYWQSLLDGRSGVGPITLFDARRFPVRIAAEVDPWDSSMSSIDEVAWHQHPRQTQFALRAALDAARSADVTSAPSDRTRLGIYLGCGETYYDFHALLRSVAAGLDGDRWNAGAFMQSAHSSWDLASMSQLDLNVPAAVLAGLIDAQGPCSNCVAACATSTQAVGEAACTIVRGDADMMLCGGAHSMIHPFGLTSFYRLSALSTRNEQPERASSPFDRHRDGFVIGEGAAVVVLEEREHAQRRGVEMLCEVTGYGNAQDASHVTDPHPEGRGAVKCMNRAIADAGLRADQIDYINAHGTSTKVNDRIETRAIKEVFGDHAYQLPISSTKSMIGHLTTAGGAAELIACVMTLWSGIVHPTVNYQEKDPECDLDYVPNEPREVDCRHILSNSFGFGGQNASLVLSRLN